MFKKLAEHQIRKAQKEGQLENLEGEGKPLNVTPSSDPTASFGYSAMARAGAVPKEIELKKAIIEQRRRVAAETNPERRRSESAKLADLEMRHAIESEARRKFSS